MFKGKSVLITGASSGLGRSLAIEFSKLGAKLILSSRNESELIKTKDECLKFGSYCLLVTGDVSNASECQNIIDQSISKIETIDYLVLNAGISMWAKFEEIEDISLIEKINNTNYLGSVYLTHYALPYLKKNNGTIVVISSVQGKVGVPYHTGYSASKHALLGFFNSLRAELKNSGVKILTVLPHWISGTKLRQNALGKDGKPIGNLKKEHSSEAATVDKISKKIIKAIAREKRELIFPSKLKALILLNHFAPKLADLIISTKVHKQD